jgi:hypothetical protein
MLLLFETCTSFAQLNKKAYAALVHISFFPWLLCVAAAERLRAAGAVRLRQLSIHKLQL